MPTFLLRKLPLHVVFLAGMMLFSCNNPKSLTQAEMEAIAHNNNTQLEKCFLAGDAEKLALMYDENAKLSPDGGDFTTGRKAIAAFWKENLAVAKTQAMRTTTLSVSGNADIVYETGTTYSETLYKDSVYKSTVKFVNVWKHQEDGSWKLAVDFWNDPKK